MKRKITLALTLALLALTGCKAKHTYPDPAIGWHNADFSVIFGRLQRVPALNPDDSPVWIVRYGLPNDIYRGQLALTPPQKFVGYSGSEQVEIHGLVRPDLGHPDYVGTWYEVRTIKLWENYR